MKQVINGKTYNTETATEIAEDSYGFSSDFNFWQETLYVTKKGAYFVAGEGGALSSWSRSCGQNESCGGSGIRPLDKSEAMKWCERHDVDADTIEERFEVEAA